MSQPPASVATAAQLMCSFRNSSAKAECVPLYDAETDLVVGQAVAPLTVAEERAVNAAADLLEAYFQQTTAILLQPRSKNPIPEPKHDDHGTAGNV